MAQEANIVKGTAMKAILLKCMAPILPLGALDADQLRRRSERQARVQQPIKDDEARHASKKRALNARIVRQNKERGETAPWRGRFIAYIADHPMSAFADSTLCPPWPRPVEIGFNLRRVPN
jgi:hypothetical protein